MTDITKCLGIKCKRKKTCFRYTANADSIYQSYSDYYKNKKCGMYWPVEEKKKC